VRAHLVGPVLNVELVYESTGLGMKPEPPRVLGWSGIPKLTEDKSTVAHNCKVRSVVSHCGTEADQRTTSRFVHYLPTAIKARPVVRESDAEPFLRRSRLVPK
jgi:hypothetical protein